MEFFADPQSSGRGNKLKLEKYEKKQTKTVGISFIFDRKYVSLCVYVCVWGGL